MIRYGDNSLLSCDWVQNTQPHVNHLVTQNKLQYYFTVVQLVEALRYKPGHRFNSQLCQWNFPLT
jgi:hypothetical protein